MLKWMEQENLTFFSNTILIRMSRIVIENIFIHRLTIYEIESIARASKNKHHAKFSLFPLPLVDMVSLFHLPL